MVVGGMAWRLACIVTACAPLAACGVSPPTERASDSCAEPRASVSQRLEAPACSGVAQACTFRARGSCLERLGCAWDVRQRSDPYDDVCAPTAAGLLPCRALPTRLECELHTGCTWGPSVPQPAPPQASAAPALGCPGSRPPTRSTEVDASADALGMR